MLLAFRASSLAAAIAICAAGLRSPYVRHADGAFGGGVVWTLGLALALILVGWTFRSRWQQPGLWLGLAIIGQAAALQLINAGTLIHYQHYRLPPQALGDPQVRWPLLAVAFQAAVVLAGLAARRKAIFEWLKVRTHLIPLLSGAAMSMSLAAAVSRNERLFVAELCFGALIQFVNAANVLLASWALPADSLEKLGQRLDSWLGGDEPGPIRLDWFAWFAALWVTVTAAALAWIVYERHPHLQDEVVYLYNARYFATGAVAMPPPPVPAAFEVDLMDHQPDKWVSAVPIGWPAVLMIGALLHVAWLVNPILAGIDVLLLYLLLGELYSRLVTRMAVLLLCASPWFSFLAMSYMTHTLTLTFALIAILGVARARRTGLLRWAWIAGIGTGACSLVRPLDGAIVGVLAAAWAMGLGGARLKLPALAALAAGTLLAGAIALPYNRKLTGDPLRSALMDYSAKRYGPGTNDYGFGRERGQGWPIDPYPGHTPFEALILAELNGSTLNTDLFGWSAGSLGLLAAFLVSRRKRHPDYLMLAAIVLVVLAYAPYWTNGGPDFGARYWFLAIVPCVALSARALEWFQDNLRPGRNDVRATAAVIMLCGIAFVIYVPWRSLDKYHHYLGMRPDIRELAATHRFGNSVVFIRGKDFPDYASAVIYNPIDLHAGAPIYVWDRSPEVRAEVMRAYPDRCIWVVDGPSVTQQGFEVAAGPLPAGSLP